MFVLLPLLRESRALPIVKNGARFSIEREDDVVAFDINVQTGTYQTGKVTSYTFVSAELVSRVFFYVLLDV